MALVRCELARVVMSESRLHQVIVLKEKVGERKMPIVIGLSEVFAIHRVVNDEPPPRPLTHELFGHVLDALGVSIQRIVVNALNEGVYYGRLVLKQNGQTYDIDSRPSDAIALAVQKGAPIFVEEEVLESAAREL
ncbi:MAG: bifunctional nuclease family protein [Planctomycetota bacterium]|jgi:bifunctional DNase/RNase